MEAGLVVLLGVAIDDSEKDAEYLADKIVNLRIFSDDRSKFNVSCLDLKAEILVISQFTLLADYAGKAAGRALPGQHCLKRLKFYTIILWFA